SRPACAATSSRGPRSTRSSTRSTRPPPGQGSLSVEVTGEVIEELVGQLIVRRRADERRQRREARVRRALGDDGVLSMVFQPICRLGDREPVGFEALARFAPPPKRGPERWFAEASEVGLRRELELAAVRLALPGLADVPDALALSRNVSPATLAAAGFRK